MLSQYDRAAAFSLRATGLSCLTVARSSSVFGQALRLVLFALRWLPRFRLVQPLWMCIIAPLFIVCAGRSRAREVG
ncbi:hypothetical protein ACOSP7_007433 [Xanthoceras sorbifolium]